MVRSDDLFGEDSLSNVFKVCRLCLCASMCVCTDAGLPVHACLHAICTHTGLCLNIEQEESVMRSAMDPECNLQPTLWPHGAKRMSSVIDNGTRLQSVFHLHQRIAAEAQHSVQPLTVGVGASRLAYEQYD